jgi:ligand-binding sensor domain-containing protein
MGTRRQNSLINNRLVPLLAICMVCGGYALPAQSYNFVSYSAADGLTQSNISAALSSRRGYLWLGTPGSGLSRFDGRNFEHFSTRDSLPSNQIQALLEDSKGKFWVGTSAGIAHFDGRSFRALPAAADLSVTALAQKPDTNLWIGTEEGVYEYLAPENRLQKAKLNVLLDQLPVRNFYPGSKGLWIATDRGAWHWGDSLTHIGEKDGLISEAVRDFTRGPDGQLWILTYDHGISILDEGTMQMVAVRHPPALVRALCAFTDKDGQVWIGTQDRGVFVYDPREDRWHSINERNGLPHNHVRRIFADQWGNIWIATSGGGVARYLGQSFVHYDRSDGLPDDRIYALAQDAQNRLWISAGRSGITLYDEQDGFRPMTRDSGLINVPVRTMLNDSRSRMWVGTDGLGLFVFDSTGLRRFSQWEGLPDNWIAEVAEDSAANIWIAARSGALARIHRLDERGVIVDRIGLEEGLDGRNITAIQADGAGRLWFGSREGEIGYFENNRLGALHGREAGLPGTEISSIAFDELERIWVGTAGAGIYYANTLAGNVRFRPLNFPGGDPVSRNIHLLIRDAEGNLWAGHERGLEKVQFGPAGELENLRHFGVNEGFPGRETSPGAALLDHEGHLWFGAMDGLIKHRPVDPEAEATRPLIHLRAVTLFYQPLEESTYAAAGTSQNGLELPYRQNHLGFSFKGLHLSHPDRVQYRWRLNGLEENWSPLSANELVNYSNLPPGRYTFQVQSCSGPESCSEPAVFSFRIGKPLWRLWWFRLAGGLALSALLYSFIRWRIRLVRRQEETRREKLEVQNHLLQLEQKALQLQMNPHFIFNALNSIQSLASTRDTRETRRQISHFANLMRMILANSRREKISLQEEIATLESYLRMEQFCREADFTFSIQPPPDIDPEEIAVPPMLIQPFVENAVVHGVAHLPGRGAIDIQFSLREEILTCEISDNGVGRKRASGWRRSTAPGHQSTAMEVNRQRLESLLAGRQLKALEVIDLTGEEGRAAGTRVILRIPVKLSF